MSKEIEISPRQIAKAIDDLLDEKEELQERIDKAIEIIESYNLGKYDFNIPTIGIIELLEILKGEQSKNNLLNSDIALILIELEMWLKKEPGYKPVLTKLNELKQDYKERYLDNE